MPVILTGRTEFTPTLTWRIRVPLTCWMYSHARHPLAVGHQLLGKLLAQQMVNADATLGGHEQEGPGGVESHTLHLSMAAAERALAAPPAQLVDQHLRVPLAGQHHSQVVPSPVPGHLCHWLEKSNAGCLTRSWHLAPSPPRPITYFAVADTQAQTSLVFFLGDL